MPETTSSSQKPLITGQQISPLTQSWLRKIASVQKQCWTLETVVAIWAYYCRVRMQQPRLQKLPYPLPPIYTAPTAEATKQTPQYNSLIMPTLRQHQRFPQHLPKTGLHPRTTK